MINHALLGYHLTQHALHAALNVSSLSLPLPRLSLLPAVVTCHLHGTHTPASKAPKQVISIYIVFADTSHFVHVHISMIRLILFMRLSVCETFRQITMSSFGTFDQSQDGVLEPCTATAPCFTTGAASMNTSCVIKRKVLQACLRNQLVRMLSVSYHGVNFACHAGCQKLNPHNKQKIAVCSLCFG